MSSRLLAKMSARNFQKVCKVFSRHLEDVSSSYTVLVNTLSKRLQDFFWMYSSHFPDVLQRRSSTERFA